MDRRSWCGLCDRDGWWRGIISMLHFRVCGRRGSVVLVAGYYKKLEVDLSKIVWSEAVVTGSNCYAYSGREKDFDAAIELIASGRVDPTKIVTHRYGLDEIVEAFQVAADKKRWEC